MFSSTAEYALRAVAYLAVQEGHLSSSQTIADYTKVPAGYLSKILNDLVNAGMVSSKRGPSGGFALIRPAETLTVLEVVNAVDPLQRITVCPLGIPAHGTNLCKLHRRLDDAIALVEGALSASTIAELVERREGQVFPLDVQPPVKPTIRGNPAR